MSDVPTPRTDLAAYGMGRVGPDRDTERWCDLLNESRAIETDLALLRQKLDRFSGLLLEAADSVHASLAESDISDARRAYRKELEERLRLASRL